MFEQIKYMAYIFLSAVTFQLRDEIRFKNVFNVVNSQKRNLFSCHLHQVLITFKSAGENFIGYHVTR